MTTPESEKLNTEHRASDIEHRHTYPETADIETSNDDYATRFAGATGAWLLEVQEKLTLRLIHAAGPKHAILDVGGGHGQLTNPLCAEGYEVTVLGSDPSCAKRIAPALETGRCIFQVGNVIDLPSEDNAFDTVIAFRMVTHCERWPELVAELTRVARKRVIVDYPTSQSLNAVAPALFNAKKKIEVNTRTWALFKHHQVMDEFAKHGYHLNRRYGQFFLPMVVHRMLKCRPLSAGLEAVCRALGLTALWGTPVIVEMTPGESGS